MALGLYPEKHEIWFPSLILKDSGCRSPVCILLNIVLTDTLIDPCFSQDVHTQQAFREFLYDSKFFLIEHFLQGKSHAFALGSLIDIFLFIDLVLLGLWVIGYRDRYRMPLY